MKLTKDKNQCPSCDKYFNSTYAFEKHRVGDHGVDRRCKTTEEMLSKGMAINHRGFWVNELMNRKHIYEK
jgi:hypothetical protein